jgi:hypothetical protein
MEKGDSKSTATLAIISLTWILIRVVYVIYRNGKPLRSNSKPPQALSTLIVLGSGKPHHLASIPIHNDNII